MVTDLNLALFNILNGLAGKNEILDAAMVFAAKYLIYAFGIYLALLWLARSKYRQETLLAGYAALLGLGINLIIPLFYFHPRPFMIPVGTLLIEHAPETSFPSDHTTLMLAVSLMFLTSRELRSRGGILLVLSLIGGLARVYTGLHFPMDIAGSLFVALVSTGTILLLKRHLLPINRMLISCFGNIEGKLRKNSANGA